MLETHGQQGPSGKALATNRPWLAVAGCLGGGVVAGIVCAIIVIAVIVFFVFFPGYFSGKPGPTAFIAALGELRKALRCGWPRAGSPCVLMRRCQPR